METATFDTYNLITRLKEAGMEEKQAAAIADTLKEVRLADIDALVTKEYFDTKLDAAITKAGNRLLMWLIPILLGQIAVFAAVVKFL